MFCYGYDSQHIDTVRYMWLFLMNGKQMKTHNGMGKHDRHVNRQSKMQQFQQDIMAQWQHACHINGVMEMEMCIYSIYIHIYIHTYTLHIARGKIKLIWLSTGKLLFLSRSYTLMKWW